ncbi:MAG: F0F1 ATP synthase subunit A [Candidatus Gottesmanbacteria bacterium]|nr:F0F1 ATP synthase subunit A [Candidatus Gottesmanbacteria bacterium]
MPQITLAAEKIGSVFGLPITNSLLATWVVMAILIVFSLVATHNMTLVPRGLQSIAEMVVGGLYDFFTSVAGKYIKQFFPLVASFFLFILVANWFGLLPGVGTIGFYEAGKFVPLLRGSNTDLNMTLALAIISIVAIQYFGFKTLGFHYSTRFLNFKGPIDFFVGILEIISQLANILSFTFRLFGNIFAGEVLLTVMAFLMPFIVPLPFMALELFVGFIQALVFSMLTAAFLNVAVSHGAQEHAKHAA